MESNGVPILVDMKSLLYLDGTEIDFRDEVMGRGFVFKNPNATSSCGCGSSFRPNAVPLLTKRTPTGADDPGAGKPTLPFP